MSGARGAANLNIRESQYLCRFVEIERYSEKTLDVSSLGSILRDFEMSRPYPPESRAFESLIFRRFRNMPPGGLLVVKSQYLFGNVSGDDFFRFWSQHLGGRGRKREKLRL